MAGRRATPYTAPAPPTPARSVVSRHRDLPVSCSDMNLYMPCILHQAWSDAVRPSMAARQAGGVPHARDSTPHTHQVSGSPDVLLYLPSLACQLQLVTRLPTA